MKYLALLRGINVGGNNIIKKDALKKCFEEIGLTNVRTYIQSGNILFQSETTSHKKLTQSIEKALSKKLKNKILVLVLSEKSYRAALNSAPKNWGKDPDKRDNALFLIDGSDSKKHLSSLPPMTDKDENVEAAPGVLFWSTSKANRASSFYAKGLVKHPLYKKVTIRNSNTSFKLIELFDEI